jgi:glutamine synthetase
MSLAERCGAHSPARQQANAAVMQRLKATQAQQLRVSWADLHGVFRSKTLVCDAHYSHITHISDALVGGIGMVSTLMLKDTSDRTAFKVFEPGALDALEGFAAANNFLLLPEPESLQLLPWAQGTAWLRATPYWPDGSPVLADPRGVLKRALAALAAQGLALRCGLEIEFHVYRIREEGLAADSANWPAEPPQVDMLHPGYQLLSEAYADACEPVLALIRHTAQGLGLPLQSLEIELGPSQFEAVFAPTDALEAADQFTLFRNAVRQALKRAGYHASFVSKPPFPNAVASGWHLHQSLVDLNGTPAMGRDKAGASPGASRFDAKHVLSDTAAHWLAGLLLHAPGMAALCAPSITAYSRYQGSVMAPQSAVWGFDNRGAMLRVLGQAGRANDTSVRIENRLGEPMANPYLLIAAQVFAGLDGVQRQLAPPLATETPYAASENTLPSSLGAALQALADDTVLSQGLGGTMARVFHAVKQQELARHAAAADKAVWERREYFGRY